MTHKILVCAALAVLALAACSRPQPPVMIIPQGWQKVDAGDVLSLYAPPGTVFHSAQGDASSTGHFTGNGFVARFDYGPSSSPLGAEASDPAYHAEHFGVGSQLALFEVGPSRNQDGCAADKTVAALYVHGIGPDSLMISACMDDPGEAPAIRTMFRTIRFAR